jgi:hypothetical protein
MLTFCTLFDSNYLSRGLSMYYSLRQHCEDFQLFVFAFDERTYTILKKMALSSVKLISLKEFEDEILLQVKPTRSKAEYCWTATSSTILFVLEKYGVESCTYIDADLYFYDSPKILIDEMKEKSILLTEHRYTPERDLSSLSGKYCVQFITFKNDDRGLKALKWWRSACIEWCYARAEDGKYGDQKYLDDWTTRFEGVHVLQHLGGGVAPWNVQQYNFFLNGNTVKGRKLDSDIVFKVVFYHFHYIRYYTDKTIDLGDYYLTKKVKEIFYYPYLAELGKSKEIISEVDNSFDSHGPREKEIGWRMTLVNLKRRFYNRYNIFTIKEINRQLTK